LAHDATRGQVGAHHRPSRLRRLGTGGHASLAAFALVAVASGLIDVAAFWLLTAVACVPPLLANAVSYCLGGLNSFALNRRITFHRQNAKVASLGQALRFVLARGLCLLASSLFLAAALLVMPALPAKAVSAGLTFVLAYTLARRLVFR
jgi:putative flippase GtrA